VKEQNGLAPMPQLVNNNPINTLLSNAMLDFASGSGQPLYHPDCNNFAPNIGLAWDVFGDAKTAVRGGYSVNYVNDEYLVALTGNLGTNAGLSQTVTNPTALASLVRNGLPAITTPTFKVPRTFLDNYNLSPTSNFAIPDPNLRRPRPSFSARSTTTRSISTPAASYRTSSSRKATASSRRQPACSIPTTTRTSPAARYLLCFPRCPTAAA
jgi:hypothetical protein